MALCMSYKRYKRYKIYTPQKVPYLSVLFNDELTVVPPFSDSSTPLFCIFLPIFGTSKASVFIPSKSSALCFLLVVCINYVYEICV